MPKRRRRPSARNEPFVPLLAGVEMQPAARSRESARAQRVVTGVRDVSSKALHTQYRDRAILELNTYTPNAPSTDNSSACTSQRYHASRALLYRYRLRYRDRLARPSTVTELSTNAIFAPPLRTRVRASRRSLVLSLRIGPQSTTMHGPASTAGAAALPAADAPPAVDLPPEDLRGGLVYASWPVSLQGGRAALCAR